MASLSLSAIRKGQNIVGELMESRFKDSVIIKLRELDGFKCAWVIPSDESRQGVILYLHGGGYTCGDIEYSLGFGSMLAAKTGTRVFCAAYRLAPENPYPAAVVDAFAAYKYLLDKGYLPEHITLSGESAGGGLCYALCLKLREAGMSMPAGIIALSPWVDLTMSGESHKTKQDVDPALSGEMLTFFSDSYAQDKADPMVSPIFADLTGMPPGLIFVGTDEILLSDSEMLHAKLIASGVQSKLTVTKDRWHAYLLYGLKEDERDFVLINKFLNKYMAEANKLTWLRLDNAAKIYPAARRQNWSNVFRVSATLTEDIDRDVMQTALDVTVRRFPSIAVRLCKGVFWYYLEQIHEAPVIRDEMSYPLTRMSKKETGKCAFRVIVYKARVAVEIFHSLTDGNGALVFLKSLVAEYILQKFGVRVPPENGVLGRLEEPSSEELEDSFQKYGGNIAADRRENTAWRVVGEPELGGFLNLTCLKVPSESVVAKAHEYKLTVTEFLCTLMMMALQDLQKDKVKNQLRRKPIKVLIPVNLRRIFPSKSLRNFAMYTTPEILPQLGEYSFEEIVQAVRSRMMMDITPKQMSMKIAVNVNSERIMAVRVMPLFIKNIVMRAIFDTVGECKSCLSLSNLGAIKIPDAMNGYVSRFDFILGVQATAPYNCGVLSYGDTTYINFIRNTKRPELERKFYEVLRDFGIPAEAESNQKN